VSILLLFFFVFLDWFRYVLVKIFFIQGSKNQNTEVKEDIAVAILQPILSGDSKLSNNLKRNLSQNHSTNVEWIWLVDEKDTTGQKICKRLIKAQPHVDIQLIVCPDCPLKSNPKVFKLDIGLTHTQANYIAILDDDTMVSPQILSESVRKLKEGKGDLVFGLPYYISQSNMWSSLVASFVNSNSLLTYIPYTFFFEPITINGMYYMTTRSLLITNNVFKKIEDQLCDDYAIANYYRLKGLKLLQTSLLHPLDAKIETFMDFNKLLRRWFLFPVVSFVPKLTVVQASVFFLLIVLPQFSVWIALLVLLLNPSLIVVGTVTLFFITKALLLSLVDAKYLSRVGLLVPMFVMQLVAPLYILVAILGPREIIWRDKRIRVLPSNKIEIIS